MRSDITAVILAGGQSRRFGSNKHWLGWVIQEQEFPSHEQQELTFFDVDTQEQFKEALQFMEASHAH